MSSTLYGVDTFSDFFSPRQLTVLTALSESITEVRAQIAEDALSAGLFANDADAYSKTVTTYLAFALDRCTDYWSMNAIWESLGDFVAQTFRRQILPFVYDYAEGNPFSSSTTNFRGAARWITRVLERLPVKPGITTVQQLDAAGLIPPIERPVVVITDPPYYDNVPYADISDYFYVWLRRTLGATTYPNELSTLLVPKEEELVAAPHRFPGGKEDAEEHFESGLRSVFRRMRQYATSEAPVSIFYAYRQQEQVKSGGMISTGWQTMLAALIGEGFQITGTWPMRTEKPGALKAKMNALASSVVIVCRPRPKNAPVATLPEFTRALHTELPSALHHMIAERHISAVDVTQATIGPGMAVYSRYSAVLEPDGTPMDVQQALRQINEVVEEFRAEREGSFDPHTQVCIRWFEENRFGAGTYDDVETMARAKGISVDSLETVLPAVAGKAALLHPPHYRDHYLEWDPAVGTSVWVACHHLAAALEDGEQPAADLAYRMGGLASQAIELAYRLYAICEGKGWSAEGILYNGLTSSWPSIQSKVSDLQTGQSGQQAEFNA